MTKRELVIDVAEKLGYTQNEVSSVVQATLESICESLSKGNRIEIRNFGVFEIKVRDARIGRNPRTGDAVPIEEKRVPVFKPGKALKELVENTKLRAQPSEPAALAQPAEPAGVEAPPQSAEPDAPTGGAGIP